MTFEEILDQAIAMLQRRGRLTYGALKRQFQLDDAYLEDVKAELIEGQRVAVDEDGRVLVWTGDVVMAPTVSSKPVEVSVRTPLTYTPPYLAEKIRTSRSALEGERKQVTVLFADLKGSMELLADRDPEEARQLLDPVLERLMAAVHRYEGTVNQIMGDGIMALFGAPIALEDHAVRACYAALRMQDTVKQYAAEVQRTHGVPLQIRVGLNAGEVVVRAIGNDLHMDYSAIGQTTHLAARMEQMAIPGTILLTPAVLSLADGFIQVTPVGPVPIKGLAEPVEVFELVGASTLRRRLQTAVARGLSPFVGRQPELEALQQALARAGAGQGQVVALLGEPGVGKSRLVYEFLHTHHTQGWLRLESSSVSYGKATAYLPVCDLLKAYCHVEDRDDLRTVRAKITGQLLTLDDALQETVPAVLALFEALPADHPFLALDPLQRRRRTLEALKRLLLRESQEQPLLLVFEDLHWIDSETQAVLDSLVESLPTARILLLVNYRPEYQHGWGRKTCYTQLRLDPLPEASTEALLQALLGADASLVPLTPLLMARTQGNPFFLEESVRTLVETGVLAGDRGAYRLAQPLDTLQVPATVQALLAARIDRLPPEDKRLLQTAAVIGTEVPWTLLQAIADTADEALYRGLAQLQAAEFLYETSLFPERAYTFKHALTHEVAYGSLLHERRRGLHARIVETLEGLAGDRGTEQVERLAQHALRGALWDKAATYCRDAGSKAFLRSANREAVLYFEQTLLALAHGPESRARHAQALDVRLTLSAALMPLAELSQMSAHLRAAEALAQALGDPLQLGRVATQMAQHFWLMGDPERALAAAQRALTIRPGDLAFQTIVHLRLAASYYTIGDYPRALRASEWSIATLEGALLYERRHGQVSITSVSARNWLSLCCAELGTFREGMARANEALQVAEGVHNPFSLVQTYRNIGLLAMYQGDVPRAIPPLERAMDLCQGGDITSLFPHVAAALGLAYVLSGCLATGVPLLEQGAAAWGPAMGRYALVVVWLSEAYLLAGRLDEAIPCAERALALARTHKERGHEAWALRLLGAVQAQGDTPAMAQAAIYYHQALALAEELGMRPLLAHCYLGLGMLYAKTGQRQQARAALATAIEMYRGMEMTFWLPQAEAALVQVDAQ
jgi:class 3 adenylate cyclase/tetratricopeptide (TPR) repeat protein